MLISLQGCMAAGKTTIARNISNYAPWIHISYEDNTQVTTKVKSRDLNPHNLNDYIEIQKLWIEKELLRYKKTLAYPITIMDFGPEEILFYTYNYPLSIGMNWNIDYN